MSDHHRRMIRYSVAHMGYLEEQIHEMDQDIGEAIRAAGLEKQWQLLQTVPGIQERSAASILAETGADMTQFPSERHFSSWAGVCPGNNRSADKNKSSHTTGGNPWLRGALTECAWAAAATKDCFLKDKFWKIVAKSGGEKAPAVIAVAHSMVKLIYQVLSTGEPFRDKQEPVLNERQKQRMIRHHVRRLGKLGIAVPATAPVAVNAAPAARKVKATPVAARRRTADKPGKGQPPPGQSPEGPTPKRKPPKAQPKGEPPKGQPS